MLRAIDYAIFIDNPSTANSLTGAEQALLLMLLRDSLTAIPANSIAWLQSPKEAYISLQKQFSYLSSLQRDSLYREFYTLSFYNYKGTLAKFNATFRGLLARLMAAKVTIEGQDQVNLYLSALEKSFPQWAERIRGTLRTLA